MIDILKIGIIIMGFLISAISGSFADKRIRKKKEWDTSSPQYRATIRRILNNKYDNTFLMNLRAEQEYQKYLKESSKREISIEKYLKKDK